MQGSSARVRISDFADLRHVRLALRNPDFTTAARIEQAINADFGHGVAAMLDAGTVLLDIHANAARPRSAHAIETGVEKHSND